jgi:glutaredoxin
MNIKTDKNKFLKILLLPGLFAAFAVFSGTGHHKVFAQQETAYSSGPALKIHLFYSETCPHCKNEKEFLKKMEVKYPSVEVKLYEVSTDESNLKLFRNVGAGLSDKSGRVPFLVIGEEYVLGYLSDETHGAQIEQLIINGLNNPPKDLVEEVKNETFPGNNIQTTQTTASKGKFEVDFPILGKIDVCYF